MYNSLEIKSPHWLVHILAGNIILYEDMTKIIRVDQPYLSQATCVGGCKYL